jgi:hypothetical protein
MSTHIGFAKQAAKSGWTGRNEEERRNYRGNVGRFLGGSAGALGGAGAGVLGGGWAGYEIAARNASRKAVSAAEKTRLLRRGALLGAVLGANALGITGALVGGSVGRRVGRRVGSGEREKKAILMPGLSAARARVAGRK